MKTTWGVSSHSRLSRCESYLRRMLFFACTEQRRNGITGVQLWVWGRYQHSSWREFLRWVAVNMGNGGGKFVFQIWTLTGQCSINFAMQKIFQLSLKIGSKAISRLFKPIQACLYLSQYIYHGGSEYRYHIPEC